MPLPSKRSSSTSRKAPRSRSGARRHAGDCRDVCVRQPNQPRGVDELLPRRLVDRHAIGQPIGAACAFRLAGYYDGGAARDPSALAMRQRSIAGSLHAGQEDDAICEAVQRARRSPAHRAHFYSPFWDRMHWDFNRMVLADLER